MKVQREGRAERAWERSLSNACACLASLTSPITSNRGKLHRKTKMGLGVGDSMVTHTCLYGTQEQRQKDQEFKARAWRASSGSKVFAEHARTCAPPGELRFKIRQHSTQAHGDKCILGVEGPEIRGSLGLVAWQSA